MDKFLEKVLGTTDVPTYCAAFLLALLGAIAMFAHQVSKRNKTSERTPYKFSLKFFIQDNWSQFVVAFLITFFAFRFTNEFLGKELTMWLAVGIGAFNKKIAETFFKSKP